MEISDSHQWLEDEKSPEVQQWVAEQNELTDRWFERVDVDRLTEELKEDLGVFSKGSPWRRGDTYFWYERKPGQDHHVLFCGADPEGKKTVVIDVNGLSKDGSMHKFRGILTVLYNIMYS